MSYPPSYILILNLSSMWVINGTKYNSKGLVRSLFPQYLVVDQMSGFSFKCIRKMNPGEKVITFDSHKLAISLIEQMTSRDSRIIESLGFVYPTRVGRIRRKFLGEYIDYKSLDA